MCWAILEKGVASESEKNCPAQFYRFFKGFQFLALSRPFKKWISFSVEFRTDFMRSSRKDSRIFQLMVMIAGNFGCLLINTFESSIYINPSDRYAFWPDSKLDPYMNRNFEGKIP